jgi:hypothetical protein
MITPILGGLQRLMVTVFCQQTFGFLGNKKL